MDKTDRIEYLPPDEAGGRKVKVNTSPPGIKWVRLATRFLGTIAPKLTARLAFRLFSTPLVRARHRKRDQLLATARTFEFAYDDLLLTGYEWGRGPRNVLLVHGWESRGTALRYFVPPLLNAGYHVYTFDGPAHGQSAGKMTHLLHFGGAVREMLERLGKVEAIIGHSFGGSSSVYCLSHLMPQFPVPKLALIASPSSSRRILESNLRLIRAPERMKPYFFRYIENRLGKEVDEVNISLSYGKGSIEEVLVVHDKQDPAVPFSEALEILDHWPNAYLLASDGLGHIALMKDRVIIDRVADFIFEPAES